MRKKTRYLATGGLLLFAVFLRIYRIPSLPLEMHIDEAGMGLNAWSIANFGTDRYGNFMPVCPINFYGEQSAFYTYFCALLVKIFGLNLYTLRLPGVIMGIATVWFGALLMREKWGEGGWFAGLALLGIFPYFIMNCRFALDCNAMLGMLTVSVYALVRLVKKAEKEPERGRYLSFVLVGLLFGITLYTYIIAAIVEAVFCTLFGIYYILYRREARSRRLRQLICMALPLVLMVIPLGLVVCVNYFDWDPMITPFFSIAKMPVNRTEEVAFTLSDLPGKLRALLYPLTSDGKAGSSGRYWTMYWWSVPMVAAGIWISVREGAGSVKKKIFSTDICMLLVAAAEVMMFLLCGQYNYHINGIFIALAYFCINGIFGIGKGIKGTVGKRVYTAALVCLYGFSFLGFSLEYYGADRNAAGQVYHGIDEALSLLTQEQREGEIYVLDEVGEFYFLSHPIPPSEFLAACDGLGYIKDYENMHFHEPESYGKKDVFVCNKVSGRYYGLADAEITGWEYSCMETEYYYVFYMQEE